MMFARLHDIVLTIFTLWVLDRNSKSSQKQQIYTVCQQIPNIKVPPKSLPLDVQ